MTEYHFTCQCQACGLKIEYRGEDSSEIRCKAEMFLTNHSCPSRQNRSLWQYLYSIDTIDLTFGILLTGFVISMIISTLK
jgi:hypothetical protein